MPIKLYLKLADHTVPLLFTKHLPVGITSLCVMYMHTKQPQNLSFFRTKIVATLLFFSKFSGCWIYVHMKSNLCISNCPLLEPFPYFMSLLEVHCLVVHRCSKGRCNIA
jgi:hypothetical protein